MRRKLIDAEYYLKAAYRKDYTCLIADVVVDKKYLADIREIVNPPENDNKMYDTYELSKEQLIKIMKLLDVNIKIDFRMYFYYFHSFGIYE